MKLDPTTGRFLPTKPGEKTPKMLEVERRLGRTLEKDFHDYYVVRGFGQKRLANRWGVHRNNIFGTSTRGGRRSWVAMLGFDVRRHRPPRTAREHSDTKRCECCGESGVPLDQAHWIASADGGPAHKWNLLELCPNCHRKLHREDRLTEEKCRKVLLFRVCKAVFESGRDGRAKQDTLYNLAKAVITRTLPARYGEEQNLTSGSNEPSNAASVDGRNPVAPGR